MRLIGFAIYLGIGAMLHALCVGPHLDWTSAWMFGWLLGWPIMFVITYTVGLIGIGVAVGIMAALFMWLQNIAEWRERRRVK